jgi:P2X purinoceptor 4
MISIFIHVHRGNERPLFEEVANFTVLIKNFVEFPTFGKMFRRRNIMEEANKTYLQSCHYSRDQDPFCPVFRIQDMISLAGENFTQLAVRGGVIVVSIDWDCNLDLDFMKFCKPMYSFRRADDPNTNIAPGWNFR